MIGNQNINLRVPSGIWAHPDPNQSLNRTDRNDAAWQTRTIDYIHIDKSGVPNHPLFQSSAATMNIPNVADCAPSIRYALLYWAGFTNRNDYDRVKLRLPDKNEYHTIVAGDKNKVGPRYYCVADITSLLQTQNVLNGEYIVGDIAGQINKTGTPNNNGDGLSGGWTILLVYDYPSARVPAKKISIFDGHRFVTSGSFQAMTLSGLNTVPYGPVNVRMGVMSVEGQLEWSGDYMVVNGHKMGQPNSNAPNWTENFFDSSVTINGGNVLARRPNSMNNIGFDLDIFNMNNPGNSVLGNNATSMIVSLAAAGDAYVPIVTAISVEVAAPNIVIEKRVYKADGTDVTAGLLHRVTII